MIMKLARLKNKKGFTLIELIVVIAILGILAAILVPSMMTFIGNAREATAKADCRTLVTGAAAYAAKQIQSGSFSTNGATYQMSNSSDVTAFKEYIGSPNANSWGVKVDGNGGVTEAYINEGALTAHYNGSSYSVDNQAGFLTTSSTGTSS